ncbi:hypothetical protein [Hoeflea sp.]|uniref:hypothetical protein n=1 Tax=Hoeflea sp. TaxID=1940281 RepID=UPI00199545BB|nr:hypothetical protein [Hoeflea sp.]MBC7283497.1 hypothetical protein [Hoeflea sp.]
MKVDELSPQSIDCLWRFARGDMPAKDFESWIYQSTTIEDELGERDYLDVISIDYKISEQTRSFRQTLLAILPAPADCDCHTLCDTDFIEMGEWVPAADVIVTDREVDGIPWRFNLTCIICETQWLVAVEERIYDIWLIRRASCAPWPEVLTYRGLLALAKRAASGVCYQDPTNSIEIPAAICDLAEENPGIPLSEIVAVLPIDAVTAHHHAIRVIAQHDAQITLDLQEKPKAG